MLLLATAAAFLTGCSTPSDTASSAGSSAIGAEPTPAQLDTPGYQDEQPFAYNEPAIDGFYDSGYEESLYSPFSYN